MTKWMTRALGSGDRCADRWAGVDDGHVHFIESIAASQAYGSPARVA
jgi:hypothetical protein